MVLIVGCGNPDEMLQFVSSKQSGLTFTNSIFETESSNIIQYLYFYNGAGVSIGDVNQDQLPDVFFTGNQCRNRLYLNQGNLQFLDVTEQTFPDVDTSGWSTGTTMVDINGDQRLDIFVCQVGGYKTFTGRNRVYLNQGNDANGLPIFEDVASKWNLDFGVLSTQHAFLDYDLDGDLDIYLLCHSVHSTETYSDTSKTRKRDVLSGDRLLRNDGISASGDSAVFTDVSETAGIWGGISGYGLSVGISDLDANGYPDIYVSNDFHENDFLYINNGDGTFEESSGLSLDQSSTFSMGHDIADVNNDGWPDIMTTDMHPWQEQVQKSTTGTDKIAIHRFKQSFGYHEQFPRNMLQINQGYVEHHISFEETARLYNIDETDWSWSVLLADFNNDCKKDIYVSNGIIRRPNDLDYLKFIANKRIQENATDLEIAQNMPEGAMPNQFFEQIDAGFLNKSKVWLHNKPSFSNGTAIGDLDNDGDLDILVNNLNEPVYLIENLATAKSSNNHLKVSLRGDRLNTYGIGAKVFVHTGEIVQSQEAFYVRGWLSSSDPVLHFGLGPEENVDSIIVIWPDQRKTKLFDQKGNQVVEIQQTEAVTHQVLPVVDIRFEQIMNLEFTHQENQYNDQNREPLLPYLLSTQGPEVAVGDLNGDGLEDFYVCGATGQNGQLFFQRGYGNWETAKQMLIHARAEETAVCFVDVDNDGDLDLIIGTGGNQYVGQDKMLQDHLFINDGEGYFVEGEFVEYFNNTSVIASGDLEGDGDADLFIGSLNRPGQYGLSPDSYILVNDGQGRFSKSELNDLKEFGMVTDAIWRDIDLDGDFDMMVVGHWMPITFLINESGILAKHSLLNSAGWWNVIEDIDVNADGRIDFVVGNFSDNNDLDVSISQPMQLFVGDIDGNLTSDPILTYTKYGEQHTLFGLEALGAQLVHLNRRFRSYQAFAKASFDEVLLPTELEKTEQHVVHTLSNSVLLQKADGEFELHELPEFAQRTTVFSICTQPNGNETPTITMLGNFRDVDPVIGKTDGNLGVHFQFAGGQVMEVKPDVIPPIQGQVRDVEVLRIKDRPYLLIGRNNESLLLVDLFRNEL